MIVILKQNTPKEKSEKLISFLKSKNLDVHISNGRYQTILGLVGDTSTVDTELLESLEMVEKVQRISEPFKKANRRFHEDDSAVAVGNTTIGKGAFALVAGSCCMQSEDDFISLAKELRSIGATMLRGEPFKERYSPYETVGQTGNRLQWLLNAKKETGLPVTCKISNESQLDLLADVDLIQISARNMQNFDLLKALGRSDKPILLKRAPSATLQELLMAAEHILAGGNENVILCERGIRTFESQTRFTLDLTAIPVLKELSHLPVLVDPSHATGVARYVPSMALAAVAAGADGVMIEVHAHPESAVFDGTHSVSPVQFAELSQKIRAVRGALQ